MYKGQLVMHSEMGCGMWIQFHDDRGLHGDKKQFWNWDWTINFNKKTKIDHIKILIKGEIVYEGKFTYSHSLRGVYMPSEIEEKEWFKILQTKNVCEIKTSHKVKALGGEL